MLEVVAIVGGMIALAALLLWSIEALAKLIGGKRTAVLLLGVLPSLAGLAIAYLNRSTLRWWEFIAYPLAGPLIVFGVIIMGYLAVSPFGIPDILGLVCSLVGRGFKAVRSVIRPK